MRVCVLVCACVHLCAIERAGVYVSCVCLCVLVKVHVRCDQYRDMNCYEL